MNPDFLDSLASTLVDIEEGTSKSPTGIDWRQYLGEFVHGLSKGLGRGSKKTAASLPPTTPQTKPVGTIAVLTGSDWLQALYDLTRQAFATGMANRWGRNLRDIAANPQYPPWLRQSWSNERSPGGHGRYGAPQNYNIPKRGK